MNEYDINIGLQIRYLRKKLGLTLRDLSERSGLSMNAISRIENCQASPTVSSVHRLAMALGVPIAALFDGTIANPTVYIPAGSRKKMRMEGRTLEMLGLGMMDPLSEPFYVTLDGKEKTRGAPFTHPGEEFAYCLEGEVIFTIGNNDYRLRPGDSLQFKSEQPHSWENPSTKPARFLLVFVKKEATGASGAEETNIIHEFVPTEKDNL